MKIDLLNGFPVISSSSFLVEIFSRYFNNADTFDFCVALF